MRYMACLEPAGFVDVKAFEDPDETMRELELQIKKEMMVSELLKSRRKLTKEELSFLDEELPGHSRK
ncbi:hypothetical protein ANCDUO_15489 [Ancylostoma duodenale]|uniref:Uncharacterized protein n=1 Tax=Ancylostoma duodenale TaxID=51022 RepID=A0A0C2GBP1_9BILA|nr:hypothetical protein ANCDUO_15489 [Ancylostoma duodenale]